MYGTNRGQWIIFLWVLDPFKTAVYLSPSGHLDSPENKNEYFQFFKSNIELPNIDSHKISASSMLEISILQLNTFLNKSTKNLLQIGFSLDIKPSQNPKRS
jgi:hypothetical protein